MTHGPSSLNIARVSFGFHAPTLTTGGVPGSSGRAANAAG